MRCQVPSIATQMFTGRIWNRSGTKSWIFAGHTFELEKSGQYLSLQVGDYPVAVVRGADKQIRAFHNSCRHRGSKVCPEASGKVAKLVCPYHKWTFELDGRLLFAGNMGGTISTSLSMG